MNTLKTISLLLVGLAGLALLPSLFDTTPTRDDVAARPRDELRRDPPAR